MVGSSDREKSYGFEHHDGRTGSASRHDPLEVLTIALTASICGCPHWVLNTAFDENRARNRKDHAAKNLTILGPVVK